MEYGKHFHDIALVNKVNRERKATDENATCLLMQLRIRERRLGCALDRSIEFQHEIDS